MSQRLTMDEVKALIELVHRCCPDQVAVDGSAEVWMMQLAGEVTYAEAAEAILVFASSQKFADMKFPRIAPANILEMRRLIRRERGKHGWTADLGVDPDDVDTYIAALRDSHASAGSGAGNHPGGGTPEVLEATQRRRKALAGGGATFVDRDAQRASRGSGAPAGVRAELDQTRAQLGTGAPRERTPALTGGGGDDMPRLAAAAVEAMPGLAEAIQGDSPYAGVTWCGKCNKETRKRMGLDGDDLVEVECCTGGTSE